MCQPPHSLQLESLRTDIQVGEVEMRALVHLPSLTELDPSLLAPAAWPMLPQLPHLRCLTLFPVDPLSREGASSLSAALSCCAALEELTLQVDFCKEDGSDASEETEQMRWSELLHSVPNLHRLNVRTQPTNPRLPVLAVIPVHLPRLERLTLCIYGRSCNDYDAVMTQLAHPTLQQFELADDRTLTDAEVHSLLHNPRLPQLRSCKSVSTSAVLFR
jgi:hypothetical protein